MNEKEIERLVVRILGDTKPYQEELKKAVKETKEATKKTEDEAKKLEKTGKSFEDLGKSVVGAMVAIGGINLVGKTITSFMEAEKASQKLTTALKISGKDITAVSEEYKNFAVEIENITNTQKNVTNALLASDEVLNLNTESAKKAVKNAIALAAAKGGEASQYIAATAALEEGNTELLTKAIPGLEGLTNESEKVALAQSKLAEMFSAAKNEANSSSGKIAALQREFMNLATEIGTVIVQSLRPLVDILTQAIKVFNSLSPEIKTAVVAVTGLVAAFAGIAAAYPMLKALGGAISTVSAAMVGSPAALFAVKIAVATAAITAAYYASLELGKALFGVTQDYNRLNAELDRSNQLQNQQSKNMAKGTQDILAKAGEKQGEDKRNYLAEQLEVAKKEVDGLNRNIIASNKEVEELNTTWNSWTGNKVLEVAKKEVSEKNALLSIARERVEALQNEYNKNTMEESNKKINKEIKDLNMNLQFQIDTLGKSSTEIDMYKLQLRGATEAQLQQTKALSDQLKLKSDTESLKKSVDDLTTSYNLQIATFNMTAREAELYKLQIKGATESQLQNAKAADEMLTSLEKNKELMEKGKELTKEFATPLETLQDKYKELNELYQAGAIGQQTYISAAKKAEEEYSTAVNKSTSAVQSFDAALRNSAEAQARITAYRESLEDKKPKKDIKLPELQVRQTSLQGGNSIPGLSLNPKRNQDGKEGDKLITGINKMVDILSGIAGKPTLFVEKAGLL